MTRLVWPLVAVATLLLAGCATPPRPPGDAPWTAGRLSVRIDASPERAAQSLSVGFELRGNGGGGELRLNSPLGTRVASARWAPGMALLDTGDGERAYADLDELSRQTLGEALPLAALPAWLSGQPWTGAAHTPGNAGFEQLGWQVQLTRRAEGWIELRRSAPPAVLVRVKLDDAP